MSNGATIPLGPAWIPYFQEDLTLKYLDEDGVAHTGFVEFTGNGGIGFQFADLNFDDTIDVQDWTAMQNGYGSDLGGLSVAEAYGLGDLTGDFAHGLDDIQAFRDAFDAVNGAGAFARLASVPEPGALVLLMMGITLLVSRRCLIRR